MVAELLLMVCTTMLAGVSGKLEVVASTCALADVPYVFCADT